MYQSMSSAPARPSYHAAIGKIDYPMTNDYMFRAVLQRSKATLKSLIASLLHLDPDSIRSLEITNPIVLGQSFNEKCFILDISILLNNHAHINLEMQVLNEHNWPERSLSYLCRNFDQLQRGSSYLEAAPAIQIDFLNFTPFPEKEMPEFYATYQMLNIKDHHLYSDKFRLSVVDLTQIELATPEDRDWNIDHWARLFRATTWEDVKMLAKKFTNIDEAAEALYALNADQTIRDQCLAREDYIRHENWVKNQMSELKAANAELTAEKKNWATEKADWAVEKAELTTANEALTTEKAELKTTNAEQATLITEQAALITEQEALIKTLQAKLAALKDS